MSLGRSSDRIDFILPVTLTPIIHALDYGPADFYASPRRNATVYDLRSFNSAKRAVFFSSDVKKGRSEEP